MKPLGSYLYSGSFTKVLFGASSAVEDYHWRSNLKYTLCAPVSRSGRTRIYGFFLTWDNIWFRCCDVTDKTWLRNPSSICAWVGSYFSTFCSAGLRIAAPISEGLHLEGFLIEDDTYYIRYSSFALNLIWCWHDKINIIMIYYLLGIWFSCQIRVPIDCSALLRFLVRWWCFPENIRRSLDSEELLQYVDDLEDAI